ncbi:MAG: DNA primase [Euryarchaeota archaeon]|jgi:DNA primase|nr:DNA primase [Euryarchaeota archaeon]MBT5727170.1 DNA primase [Euryarchaeota archaeon]
MDKRNNPGRGGGNKQSKAMKYQIRADIKVNGTVQRKDIIGAIMGQTEGLLGDELELRKLQRTARVGHVDVEMETKGGKVHGMIIIPSSLDNVETAIIASSLETIDRIGPCSAKITVKEILDIRATKRTAVVDRAKELLLSLVNSGEAASKTVIEEVRSVLTTGTATNFHGLTCGPNIEKSSSLIIVEGRNDVRNLLNCGVKNAISADGAGTMKQELIDLANGKETVILAIDGDRGGEMLFSQLNDTIKVDFVAQAPVGQEWELLPQKTVTMCLQKKVEASKFAHALKKKQDEDDEKAGVPDKNWADDMDDEFVAPEAPAQVHEWFDHLDNLDKNNALFVMEDNTVSEAVGPKSLSKAAGETEGAVAIVFNGPVSERTLEIASESAIATVVGTKAGKGFSAVKGVEAWLSEIHR